MDLPMAFFLAGFAVGMAFMVFPMVVLTFTWRGQRTPVIDDQPPRHIEELKVQHEREMRERTKAPRTMFD